MTRSAIALFGLLAMATAAAAESLLEAGEWKVTSSAVINGATSPPQSKSRCITPEQADNVAATFGPVTGTVNSDCETPAAETSGKTLKWRLQCRGQLDIDAAGEFTFDSPRHYTAIITSKGKMAGVLISDVQTNIEAERVGDCTQ
jgi:Tfp pilus assembly protein PilX